MCTCEQRNHFTKSFSFYCHAGTHVPGNTLCTIPPVTLANLQSSKNEDPVTVTVTLHSQLFTSFYSSVYSVEVFSLSLNVSAVSPHLSMSSL